MRSIFSKIEYEKEEIIDQGIDKMEVEYYKVLKEDSGEYGIEINKEETINNKDSSECLLLESITSHEDVIDRILNILSFNKVTPIVAKDVIEDILIEENIRKNVKSC